MKEWLTLIVHAEGYRRALDEMGEEMRTIDKWGMEQYENDAQSLIDRLRDKYYTLRQEYHLPE